MKDKILYLFGSKSDLVYFKDIQAKLEASAILFDLKILSAHRNLEELIEFLKEESGNYSTIIASAGFSAALPGVVAAISKVPVLGVPISSSPIKIDALFSMIEMPKGVPLAVCSYDKAGLINATLLALKIMKNNDLYETFKQEIQK